MFGSIDLLSVVDEGPGGIYHNRRNNDAGLTPFLLFLILMMGEEDLGESIRARGTKEGIEVVHTCTM